METYTTSESCLPNHIHTHTDQNHSKPYNTHSKHIAKPTIKHIQNQKKCLPMHIHTYKSKQYKSLHPHTQIATKTHGNQLANQVEAYPHTYTTNHQTISKHKENLGFLEKHTVLQKPAIPAVGCPFRVIKCPLKK